VNKADQPFCRAGKAFFILQPEIFWQFTAKRGSIYKINFNGLTPHFMAFGIFLEDQGGLFSTKPSPQKNHPFP
jgi:hypothetical protein